MSARAAYLRLLAVAWCLLNTNSAQAETYVVVDWWSAKVPYTATLTELPQGLQTVGRLYFDHGRTRHESTFNDVLFVSVYLPEHQRQYIFTPGGEKLPSNCIDYGDLADDSIGPTGPFSEPMGREIVNGEGVTKYRIVLPEGQTSDTRFSWVTDDGIVMRTAAAGGEILLELNEVIRGPLPPDLFELPYGVPFCAPGSMER